MNIEQLREGVNGSRVIVALDDRELSEMQSISQELCSITAGGKSNDGIDAYGCAHLNGFGLGIRFLDPKIDDIANTMRNRLRRYRQNADIVTVHASASFKALQAAAETANECGFAAVAVTVLTDISSDECVSIFGADSETKVREFALKAKKAGLHGIVCSPNETKIVREAWPEALIINPGVRSPGADQHDQQRVNTPARAILDGANLVVCGRQILGQPTPELRIAEVKRINKEIAEVL